MGALCSWAGKQEQPLVSIAVGLWAALLTGYLMRGWMPTSPLMLRAPRHWRN